VWKESYRAYGERWVNDPGSAQQSQWFHGKEQDAATGLQYFGARYYDPAVGRFLGIDPVDYQDGNLHSFNRYAYGNNNPVRYADPDGRIAIPLIYLGGAALATASVALLPPEQRNRMMQSGYRAARSVGDALDRARQWIFNESSDESDKVGPSVQDNRTKGQKAEDEVATDLENAGRDVDRQVRKDTPFGPRIIDIEVKDKNGNVLGGVEVKSGGSRYRHDQRSKDEWLRQDGYSVDIVRKP